MTEIGRHTAFICKSGTLFQTRLSFIIKGEVQNAEKEKEEIVAAENTAGVAVETVAKAPVKKTNKYRAKKETAEVAAEKPARKPRAPRKKAVVPTFFFQNSGENSITYTSVVEKVQAAGTIQDVTSLDIYVKAEEGKVYYVVNGEAAGAVDLFLD